LGWLKVVARRTGLKAFAVSRMDEVTSNEAVVMMAAAAVPRGEATTP